MQKRKIRFNLFVLIIVLLFFQTISLHPQVTIGSREEPIPGALLELKEENVTIPGATATRGLGMPRVYLPKLNELTMGNPSEQQTKVPNINGEWEAHAGLMVYNVHEDYCLETPILAGLYVWNGNAWEFLGERDKDELGIYRFTDDRDSETYRFRAFGDPESPDFAGYWMLENLRYDPILHEDRQHGFNKEDFAHKASSEYPYQDKSFAYAEGGNGTYNPAEHPSADWYKHKTNGILYNWAAATNNEIPLTENDETNSQQYFRGICPEGWHLPTDKEWNDLEKEIATHADRYSSVEQDSPGWDTAWETTTGYRGNHGEFMKSQCPLYNTTTSTNGISLPATKGGFDSLFSGYANDGSLKNYGTNSYYWTASISGTAGGVMQRGLKHNDNGVYRAIAARNNFFAVRCKKD